MAAVPVHGQDSAQSERTSVFPIPRPPEPNFISHGDHYDPNATVEPTGNTQSERISVFPIPRPSEPNFIFHGDHYDPNVNVEPTKEDAEKEEGGGGGGGRRTDILNLNYYLPLYQAARDGDWKKGKEFIDENPDSITAIISIHGATALHIAASYGRSEFVEKIVKLMPPYALEMRDSSGCTALHCIAVGGTVKAAMAMVERSYELPEMVNYKNDTPLYHLCNTMPLVSATEREMVWYLCTVTRDAYPSFCFTGGGAPNLIVKLLSAGHLDICLYLFQRYPRLATAAIVEKGDDLIIGLCAATSEFPSGNTLGFFESFIYRILPSIEEEPAPRGIENPPPSFWIPPPQYPDLSHESDSISQRLRDLIDKQEPVQRDRENPPLSQHEPVQGDTENPPLSPLPDVINSNSQHVGQEQFLMQPRIPSRRDAKVVPSKLIPDQEPAPSDIENPPPPSQPDGIHSDSQHVGQVPFSMQPRMPSNRVLPPELLYEQESGPGYMENSPLFYSTPDNYLNSDAQHVRRQQSFFIQRRSCFGRVFQWLIKVLVTAAIAPLIAVPCIRRARDLKLRHYHSSALLHYICRLVIQQKTVNLLSLFQERYVLHTAAERGIVEIVAVFLRYLPDMIMLSKDSNETLLHVAVENRREKIFNLLMELHATTTSFVFTKLESGENVLHLAAKLAPSLQLNSVSGPALQMQRELQWFKEVEKLFNNTDKRLKNKDGKTPRELFTIEHKELKTKGEQWMRDTSNSCMVVTTLIATIAFAAAFTVPGGNDSQKGTPLFLNKGSFMVFAISDALALFSSVTSLIMFLAILTARYAEEDFLISLPRRLIIGLCSLFVAIATTMIAFGSGLSIVLGEKLEWIYIPVILFGCFPVALFGMLQLPLLVHMIRSTYGRSIFYRPGDCYYRNLAYLKLQ